MRRFALLATISALLTAAFGWGGGVAEGNVQNLGAPANPTHFAGVPLQGTHPSTPTTGKLILSFSVSNGSYLAWNVYADGRVIWQEWSSIGEPIVIPPGASMLDTGYVQQRLTPKGVQLLRTKILSTGLFGHSLKLRIAAHHGSVWGRVRRADHMVTFAGNPTASWNEQRPFETPAQARGLAQIQALLADSTAWSLPTKAWADREVRGFVPSLYFFAFDRSAPDLTKLPAPLLPYRNLLGSNCRNVTTGELRTILQAFREAGIPPVQNQAVGIGFVLKGFRGPSNPHFSPVLPSDSPC